LCFDSTTYTLCTSSSCALPLRTGFTILLSALFHASTYVSCQPTFIEPLLALYRGTLSTADQTVLSLFMLFEQHRKLSVGSILKLWTSGGNGVTEQKTFDALMGLEANKVFASCTSFPLRRKWGKVDAASESLGGKHGNEEVYDPVFVLSLMKMVLHEGELTGLDWVEILRSNVLGFAVCALSSRDADMRVVASGIMAKVFAAVSVSRRVSLDDFSKVVRFS
jgi:nucleolar pre-ribosomal-associated protein 1